MEQLGVANSAGLQGHGRGMVHKWPVCLETSIFRGLKTCVFLDMFFSMMMLATGDVLIGNSCRVCRFSGSEVVIFS